MKIVQIARFTQTGETNGIEQANEFLSNLLADDVVDVKFSTGEGYSELLIIYKVSALNKKDR